ncbi:MAG: hypothetical protein ABIH67_01020 [Candidatus Uhrbacteria bacterium]
MSRTVITLPDREEMLQRLMQVNDRNHVQQKLYPILLNHAGQEKVAQGIPVMLALAINDYTTGMPAVVAGMVWDYVPAWIDALVDDQDVAAEAKAFFEAAFATQ